MDLIFTPQGAGTTSYLYRRGDDGHSRIRLNAISARVNIAQGLLVDSGTRIKGEELVKRVHSRTHIHPTTLELMLKRSKKCDHSAKKELERIEQSCMVCRKAGEPQVMKKFSLSKLCREFNDVVEFDIMYWGKDMALHVVETATGYSECTATKSRAATTIKRTLEGTWFLRHGSPCEMRGDQEFEKPVLSSWIRDRGCKFTPLPARRHNKAGVVERKNRVIKDVLEKLDLSMEWKSTPYKKLAIAQFSSNILYGSKELSSFELVRGYTPNVDGTGMNWIPKELIAAHEEMEARRLLSRILKSKPGHKVNDELMVGQIVLALVPGGKRPRGEWKVYTISQLRDEHSVVVGRGKRSRVIAREDIRTIPRDEMAANVVRAHAGVLKKKTVRGHERDVKESHEWTSESEDDADEIVDITAKDENMESNLTPSGVSNRKGSKSTPQELVKVIEASNNAESPTAAEGESST